MSKSQIKLDLSSRYSSKTQSISLKISPTCLHLTYLLTPNMSHWHILTFSNDLPARFQLAHKGHAASHALVGQQVKKRFEIWRKKKSMQRIPNCQRPSLDAAQFLLATTKPKSNGRIIFPPRRANLSNISDNYPMEIFKNSFTRLRLPNFYTRGQNKTFDPGQRHLKITRTITWPDGWCFM